MNDKTLSTARQKRWEELLTQPHPPEWVRRMIDHYQRTGTYRPEDLRRLLGDPTKGVEVGPNASLASMFTEFTEHRSS